jgi:glutathione peroxidase
MQTFIFSLTLCFMSLLSSSVTDKSVHSFSAKSIDGKEIQLSQYKGKKILIVNVASECGYTPQYKDLEALYKKYGSKLVVLGFPSNEFGGQEPGSDSEIKTFCQKNYGVSFPMFSKIQVKGKGKHPLFAYLSSKEENGIVGDEPKWNFCKYLVDENGKVMRFFPSSVKPLDKEITDLL